MSWTVSARSPALQKTYSCCHFYSTQACSPPDYVNSHMWTLIMPQQRSAISGQLFSFLAPWVWTQKSLMDKLICIIVLFYSIFRGQCLTRFRDGNWQVKRMAVLQLHNNVRRFCCRWTGWCWRKAVSQSSANTGLTRQPKICKANGGGCWILTLFQALVQISIPWVTSYHLSLSSFYRKWGQQQETVLSFCREQAKPPCPIAYWGKSELDRIPHYVMWC